MIKVLRLALFSLSFFTFKKSIAQEKEIDLDPVTVTSSITPEKASRTGRNVVVIKGEYFQHLPVLSIDEFLRYLPGIEMQMRGPAGSQSDIVLRGGTFQQVLVIIDGARVNDANTGHFSSYIPITPNEIDHIEILKGASSAVYGSEAVGGVIHIITKSFVAKQPEKKLNFDIQGAVGEYDLFSVNTGFNASTARSIINAGALINSSDGQQQRGIRGFYNNKTASISAGRYFNDKWHIAVRASLDNRDFAAQNFYTTFISDTSTEKVKTVWTQMQVTHRLANNKLQFDFGYKSLEDRFVFNSASPANLNKSYLLQGLLTDEWQINNSTVVVSGLQFINKKINSNDRGNHNLDQAALFLILNKKIGERFSFNPALRTDWNERAGWELIPQLNISYRLEQWQFRASGGKTIRNADFTERFNNYGRMLVTSGRIGNPDLSAERSFSYEAGADFFAVKNIKISSTFFQRFHSNLIDYVPTPYASMPRKENLSPTGNYALAKNISKVTTTGVETDIQFSKKIGSKQSLWSTVGLIWLNSKSSEATPSFYISSHAKFLTNLSVNYTNNYFSIGLTGLYKIRQQQVASNPAIAQVSKDYFVMNAKAETYFLKKKLAAFVQADNIFNNNYVDLLGSQMPGRWLLGGLRFSSSN